MTNNYISSSSITVYPCGHRDDSIDLQARLSTELNTTRNIYGFLDNGSAVLTSTYASDVAFEFVIHGYYFKINQGSSLAALAGNGDNSIYGCIKLKTTGSDGRIFVELTRYSDGSVETLDDTEFEGLYFSNTEPTSVAGIEIYSLKLLQKDGSNWIIPPESKVLFSTGSGRRKVTIDDGTLK